MRFSERLKNSLRTPGLLIRIINQVGRQKKFIVQKIDPVIGPLRSMNDGSLDEADIKKLRGYYGLAVPAILGEAFCALRGSRMTKQERMASTCQGAMTGLGDDFFDRQRLSDQAVKDFVERPSSLEGKTASEKLFLHFYTTALSLAPDGLQMQGQLLKVFHAQLLSKEQKKGMLNNQQIQDITLRKGAESLLFYRTAFSHPLAKGEEKMLYCLGGLMQLSNDIFDVYPDLQDGIDTLLTTADKIQNIRTLFLSLLKIGTTAAYQSDYDPGDIRKFLDIISIGIFSRCLVCLDQLEKNQKRTEGLFKPRLYKRKDLVCDMDTAVNKWRSVRYHIRSIR
ncbi:MAG: hypothetical protein IPI66_10510 [Chitinophagaceae bacterium]|nr:hypothetical protein [Chitinophagaceae bacterium]